MCLRHRISFFGKKVCTKGRIIYFLLNSAESGLNQYLIPGVQCFLNYKFYNMHLPTIKFFSGKMST